MNNLEYRELVIQAARAKFIATGITKNITEALALYLKDNEDLFGQIPLFISSPEIHQIKTILETVRPRCDECDTELHLQVGALDPAGRSYPTAWICKNCKIEYYSDKTAAEWLEELRIEARNQNLRKPDEPGPAVVPPGQQAPQV